VLLLAEADIQ